MKKKLCIPRENWQQKCEQNGFYHHSIDGRYWIEDYAIEFSLKEIEILKKAASDLHLMCLNIADDIIRKGDFHYYGLPESIYEEIEKSWKNKDFDLYSRFDFSYNGIESPKMLEYNADTPTGLVESLKNQEDWLKEQFPNNSQFNYMEEKLIERWKQWKKHFTNIKKLHFSAHAHSQEDWCNVETLREAAQKAGINTVYIDLQEIGWDNNNQYFVDNNSDRIEMLFKLHPWEFLIEDAFYPHMKNSNLLLIEPMWKMLLSNKAILPLLWKYYPNHPNLLPSFFNENDMLNITTDYVKKPLLSREGANVIIYKDDQVIDSQIGSYGSEGYIYQKRHDLISFDNRYSVVGIWLVEKEPCALSIREDATLITKDTSWFIPHYIK